MTILNASKLNHIMLQIPSGMVLTSCWLKKQNVSPQLAYWYVKSGWLEHVGDGLYKKAREAISWDSAISALQNQLQFPIHIGGKTALELLGRAHFVPMGGIKKFSLFIPPKTQVPHWLLNEKTWGVKFNIYQPRLFKEDSQCLVEVEANWNKVLVSSPELAILELLYLVPKHESFDEARLLFENLKYLRPQIVQHLLEICTSVKVKRLFLYLADKYQHAWLNEMDLTKISLGSGKRVIAGGGVYNAKYKISVPQIMEEGF